MRNRRLLASYISLVSTVVVLFFFVSSLQKSEMEDHVGLTSGKSLPGFILTDADGRKTSLESFRGKVVLIFFGYSNCPDLCPMALKKYAELEQLLGEKVNEVAMIFVTTDPHRDTSDTLRQLVSKYSSRIIPLTGTWEELADVWKNYYVRPIEDTAQRGYIAHSTVIYLADRNLILRKILTPEMSAVDMLKEIERFL